MSKKQVSILVVLLAVILAVILMVVPGQTGRDDQAVSANELIGLGERVNQVNTLVVKGAGSEILAKLSRGESQWTIDNLSGYPADWEKVREVLAGLAQAKVIEQKTANPDYYARLGVEDVSAEDATSLLVELASDELEVGVILGNKAPNRSGRYARMAGEQRSVLIDFEAEVPELARGWADNSVVDIAAADVGTVEIAHPGGESISLGKISADESDFLLEGIPEGREIESSWSVNSLGGVLTALTFDDVAGADTLAWDRAVEIRLLTFSGLEVNVRLTEVEGNSWVSLSAAAPYADEESAEGTDEEGAEAAVDPAVGQASVINQRVSGWAYQIPTFKADNLSKRMEDLLKSENDESAQ